VGGEIEDLKIASGYWYMASVYSKWPLGLDDACQEACKLAGELIMRGLPVYSPIAHSHPIAVAADIDPYDHEIWLPADKPMFEQAHGLLVMAMPGWRDSYGIGKEIEWAIAMKKPRFLIAPATLRWQAIP
jgi:hypothetical protein